MNNPTKIDCTCGVELQLDHEFDGGELEIAIFEIDSDDTCFGWLTPDTARDLINALEGALSRLEK